MGLDWICVILIFSTVKQQTRCFCDGSQLVFLLLLFVLISHQDLPDKAAAGRTSGREVLSQLIPVKQAWGLFESGREQNTPTELPDEGRGTSYLLHTWLLMPPLSSDKPLHHLIYFAASSDTFHLYGLRVWYKKSRGTKKQAEAGCRCCSYQWKLGLEKHSTKENAIM